jgi:hypothetical protein
MATIQVRASFRQCIRHAPGCTSRQNLPERGRAWRRFNDVDRAYERVAVNLSSTAVAMLRAWSRLLGRCAERCGLTHRPRTSLRRWPSATGERPVRQPQNNQDSPCSRWPPELQ